ncbi:MAG: cell division protein FtsL [Gammaproteobacteria bacterium]|jgi:cell division protein FtsL|tara:strand:+ start:4055 stop:4324 length:270 start_codon:yes stop_codon:yes gene_type:complete
MNLTASFVLILLITISAFGVIFIKYQNRILNIEISENEKKHYYLSESYRQLLKDKADITDKVLQKNSLGKALNMQLPNKERILIMNIDQ